LLLMKMMEDLRGAADFQLPTVDCRFAKLSIEAGQGDVEQSPKNWHQL